MNGVDPLIVLPPEVDAAIGWLARELAQRTMKELVEYRSEYANAESQVLFTYAQAAQKLQLSEDTLRHEVDRGRLQVHRAGSTVRFSAAQLRAYVEGDPEKRAA